MVNKRSNKRSRFFEALCRTLKLMYTITLAVTAPRRTLSPAGAILGDEASRGNGTVVRRMLADVDADFNVMADGDATCDALAAPEMLNGAWTEQVDLVVGCRYREDAMAHRTGQQFSNHMLTGFLTMLFGRRFTDILSGYRVFSRRFVKSVPRLVRPDRKRRAHQPPNEVYTLAGAVR